MTDRRNDPIRSFNFELEIDDIPRGAFSDVTGLVSEVQVAEYRDGNDRQLHTRRLAGLVKASNLTLKRGVTPDDSLWQWYLNILNGVADRRNVTITLLDEARTPKIRWHAEQCWICKIEGPALKAAGNEVAMESVEIVHEGIVMELA